ncbi:MAG: alpha/beta fold hydrolase [Methylococcales bacterium]
MLLIHGLNTNMAFWHPLLVGILGRNRRLAMYDQRGHGYSDLPPTGYTTRDLACDALSVLDAYRIERADIIAHSFGSGVALQLARLHPERVRSIVILDGRIRLLQPQLKLEEWPDFDRWRSHLDAVGIPLRSDLDLDFTLPLYLQGGDLSEAGPRLEADGFVVPGSGSRATAKYRRLIGETSAADDFKSNAGLTLQSLRDLCCPVLALYGSRSPFLPTLDGLERELPDCRSELLEIGGHNFPIKFPRQTASVICRFLETISLDERTPAASSPVGT